MKKVILLKQLTAKTQEMESRLSGKTKSPDYYKTQREYRLMMIMAGIINHVEGNEIPLTEVEVEWLNNILSIPQTIDGFTDIQPGASILKLLQDHQDVKDFGTKLSKYCTKKGWILDYKEGVIK